jgi:hypothetical protein
MPNFIVTLGDSKCHGQEFQQTLCNLIHASGRLQVAWADGGIGGSNIPETATIGDSFYIQNEITGLNNTNYLNSATAYPQPIPPLSQMTCSYVLCNWGANDVTLSPFPTQTAWQNAYISVLDVIHSNFPQANVYLAYAWRRGLDTECATLKTWVQNVIAARSQFTLEGIDENVVLKGSDNGNTNTKDGVHYSFPAGAQAIAQAWFDKVWG